MADPVLWWSAGRHQVPDDDGWIDDVEARRFAAMRFTKRRDEAKMARFTAKSTVARALGRPTDPAALRAVTVRNAADGAPEVVVDGAPAGLVLAMTDRADWAVSAVLGGGHRIGCDLELVEPRSPAFVDDYFTEPERRLVAGAASPDLVANLVWSAKEAALKVLRTGLRRDTRTVEVAIDRREVDAGAEGRWAPLTVTTREGLQLPGWWIRYGLFVLTVAGAVPTTEPVSLESPPPLATAEPTHGWMERPRLDL